MRARATVRLRFKSARQLETVLEAIIPEVKSSVSRRARTTIEKEDETLVLRVEARDTVALRASLNAYLRWINSTLKVLEVLGAK